jgi:erythritol kinase (D-erythritol 1-phosphate-forming)
MTSHLVAVDAGTSMVKAVLISGSGEVLGQTSAPVASDKKPGLSPSKMWRTTAGVISELLSTHPEAPIDGVVIAGQGDGLWMLDGDGKATDRAYLWNSTEGAEIIERWSSEGSIDAHFRDFGTVLWPGSQAALWVWLKKVQPNLIAKVATVFCAKDYLNYCLTGVIATDPTDASIPFLDPNTGAYSLEGAQRLGCGDILKRLPPIIASGEQLGSVTPDASRQTGLPEGTPVFQGALDVVAMLWGSGLGKRGDVLAALGTTAVSMTVTERLAPAAEPAGATILLAGNAQLRVMGSSAGTATLEWYMEMAGYDGEDRFKELWDDIAQAPHGAEIFLPFIRGERAPILAPSATGSFLGITPKTNRARVARAVTEGITHVLRWGIDSVLGTGPNKEVGTIVLAGGGSQERAWATQVANCLGREIFLDGRSDLGARGVARMVFDKMSAGSDFAQGEVARIEPDDSGVLVRERYRLFLSAIETLSPLWSSDIAHTERREREFNE